MIDIKEELIDGELAVSINLNNLTEEEQKFADLMWDTGFIDCMLALQHVLPDELLENGKFPLTKQYDKNKDSLLKHYEKGMFSNCKNIK